MHVDKSIVKTYTYYSTYTEFTLLNLHRKNVFTFKLIEKLIFILYKSLDQDMTQFHRKQASNYMKN